MKKLFILIFLFTMPALADNNEMKCIKLKTDWNVIIRRCENEEAICYYTSYEGGLQCKFKKDI